MPADFERHWELAAGPGGAVGGLSSFSLDVPQRELARLSTLLSDDERARAARFRFPEHGARYVVAHARLRQLLAILLEADPRELAFSAGGHGKPRLADAAARRDLRFNLSHSQHRGLVGWAWGRDIGVDIECWRAMHDEAALVRRFFSPAEIAAYEGIAPAQRTEGFFNAWTRKEAYVKALGRGLALSLASFDVSLESGNARLLRVSGDSDDGRAWSLAAPAAQPSVSMAVVLQSETLFVAPKHDAPRITSD